MHRTVSDRGREERAREACSSGSCLKLYSYVDWMDYWNMHFARLKESLGLPVFLLFPSSIPLLISLPISHPSYFPAVKSVRPSEEIGISQPAFVFAKLDAVAAATTGTKTNLLQPRGLNLKKFSGEGFQGRWQPNHCLRPRADRERAKER